jgi:hypothetical protein
MKAIRFVGAGCPAQLVEVPTPRPGPGEILVKIGGAQGTHPTAVPGENDITPPPSPTRTYLPLEDAVSVYSHLEKGEIQGASRLCSSILIVLILVVHFFLREH